MVPSLRSLLATLSVGLVACSAGTTAAPTTTAVATATPSAAPASPTAPAEATTPTQAPATPEEAGTDLTGDVDVGGRALHLSCVGSATGDEPTVLLESGLAAPSTGWGSILRGLADDHHACAYDRAGLGMSDPAGQATRTAADLASDLQALVTASGLEGPVLLVAHSFGAYPAILFAERNLDAVDGVLFVDPRGPRVSGQWRDALPAPAPDEPQSVAANREELGAFETDPSLNPEHLDLSTSAAQVIAALDAPGPLFGDRRVDVLSAELTTQSWSDLPPELAATFDAVWLSGQQELADESTTGQLTVVPDVGHEIHREQAPFVLEAIESMLAGLAGT